MPSVYLQSADYTNYGASGATATQVAQASTIIDGFLHRPEGLLYSPDFAGNPAWMTAKTPLFTLTSTAAITAGTMVTFTVSGAVASIQPGSVCIFDAANAQLAEACIVNGISGNLITLKIVQNAHASGATLDFGLTHYEERHLAESRPLTMLSRTPVLRIISGLGQYGYTRQSNAMNYYTQEFNLLAYNDAFGGAPIWEQFDTSQVGIEPQTGQIWLPAGLLVAYYTDVQLYYVTGYTYANLPSAIKQACANLISAISNVSSFSGNIRSLSAGSKSIERFSANYIDDTTKQLLMPYVARNWI